MKGRSGVLLALAAALWVGPIAEASPRPQCKLIQDPEGDATINYQRPPDEMYPHSLDIRSADFATDASRLTVVIRVTELHEFDPRSPGGIGYDVQFSAGRAHFLITANRVPHD